MPIFLNTNKNILFIHPPKNWRRIYFKNIYQTLVLEVSFQKGEFGNYIPSQHLHSEEMIKSIEKLV